MDEAAERELIGRCQQGSDAAFRELVDRYKDLVFAVISRMVADRSRAEDLAQEVFLRVHRGLPYFQYKARLSTWIYRIVANVCVDQKGRWPQDLPLEVDGRIRPGMATPDRAFGDFELRDRMHKALARLSPQARFLVTAHYIGGLKYEDLAGTLNLPLGTVKTQLHRARRRLRELLSDEGVGAA